MEGFPKLGLLLGSLNNKDYGIWGLCWDQVMAKFSLYTIKAVATLAPLPPPLGFWKLNGKCLKRNSMKGTISHYDPF